MPPQRTQSPRPNNDSASRPRRVQGVLDYRRLERREVVPTNPETQPAEQAPTLAGPATPSLDVVAPDAPSPTPSPAHAPIQIEVADPEHVIPTTVTLRVARY